MCYLPKTEDCDTLATETGGFLQQTIYFTVPYATTKIRLDEYEGDPEIAFSVEFLGFNNAKRKNLFDPLEGGFSTFRKAKLLLM